MRTQSADCRKSKLVATICTPSIPVHGYGWRTN
nr:MAG TPA: hypothetical protein [Caudoviricetes sp.]